MIRLVYFVSSHGFGHAARAAAVMAAVRQRLPDSRFTVFTSIPAWFFEDSLGLPADDDTFIVRPPASSDLGLVQIDALTEDLPATIARLDEALPYRESILDEAAAELAALAPALVLADISPFGLAAARRAGLPSILVENFTWDFIYRGVAREAPELARFADFLAEIFAGADHRVQTEPFCVPEDGAVRVAPVARTTRRGRVATRRDLGIPGDEPVVLVTMGGIGWSTDALSVSRASCRNSSRSASPWIVVPGGADEIRRDGRLLRLPHRSEFYHPDLLAAADVVVGKLGYSTLAEVAQVGVPLAYLPRPRFPESPHLEAWARDKLVTARLDLDDLIRGDWRAPVAKLLERPRRDPIETSGAREIARRVERLVSARSPDDAPSPASGDRSPGGD